MEPPKGFLAILWHFTCFLPYFIGLLLLGIIKGIIFCPFICLIMTIGNSAIILGLLPAHAVWTCYCILSAKQLGPVLKLVLCICLPVCLILWPVIGIVGSILGGALYGFLSPIFATFDAVGEGKTNAFFHCFYDGTWSTVKGSFTVVRDFKDVYFHSYFSLMDDLRQQVPPDGKYYEIRLLHLSGAIIAVVLGIIVDLPVISVLAMCKSPSLLFKGCARLFHDLIGREGPFLETICVPFAEIWYTSRLLHLSGAIIAVVLGIIVVLPVISVLAMCKSPYMLFKGWARLFHDLIGREGPFLETICVPFAGLAILLWPLAVVGAVWGSTVSSIFLGAYAGVVVYQESSFWFGLCYIVASLSIYDEYSNDVLDMPEGSCFPRPQYRKKVDGSQTTSCASSFSRPSSFKNPPSRSVSLNNPMVDLKPLELLDGLFKECQRHGEIMVSEGLITTKDIEDAKSNKGGRVISIGLPAYCLLQALIRSAKANSPGLLLSDNCTEITSTNRPKDAFFDWFFNPFMIIKDQIKAANLSEAEEDYLCKLVLLCSDPARLKNSNVGPPPESERKRAELDALARRLQGITKSISRYPTFRRHFEKLVKNLSEDLGKKNGGSQSSNGPQTIRRSRSAFPRIFSQKSFIRKTSNSGSDQESQPAVSRDVDIV